MVSVPQPIPTNPQRLLAMIGRNPGSKQLIKAAVNAGLCLGQCVGGAEDGATVWTRPGPPISITVDGHTYVKQGTMPNRKIEGWKNGFFLHKYVPEEQA